MIIYDKVLDHLVAQLVREREAKAQYIANGNAATFEIYKGTAGFVQGLNHAINLINDFASRMEKAEDE